MKYFYLISTILLCNSLNAKAQQTNGLIAHWNFNSNTNDSYSTHNGIAHGIVPAAGKAGQPSTAYYFSDTNSYITIPYQPDLNLTDFSISAVVKVDKINTKICQGNFILARGHENQPGHYGLSFFDNAYDNNDCYTSDTSKFVFYALRNNAPPVAAIASYQYSPNIITQQWYCVTVTSNNQEEKVYVDGILKSTSFPTGSVGSSIENLLIGQSMYNNPLYPYQFNGYIDDIKLYNRVLADTEIMNYCNSFNGDTTTDTSQYVHEIQEPQLNIYPNPSKGNFKITGTITNSHPGEIRVLNAVGQVVYAEKLLPVNNRIDKEINLPGSIPAGTYLLQCKMADHTFTRKITITQ